MKAECTHCMYEQPYHSSLNIKVKVTVLSACVPKFASNRLQLFCSLNHKHVFLLFQAFLAMICAHDMSTASTEAKPEVISKNLSFRPAFDSHIEEEVSLTTTYIYNIISLMKVIRTLLFIK